MQKKRRLPKVRLEPPLFALMPAPPPGWFDVGYCVTLDRRLGILRCNFDPVAGMSKWKHEHPVIGRLSVFDGKAETEHIEFELPVRFPIFSRCASGSWVMADIRCRPGDANAVLLSSEGAIMRRFRLGDGIEHLQCDINDNVWVGYFDEGVFGNDGWLQPGEKWPVSAAGLVKFGPDGSVLWRLPDSSMADCYVLNVGRRKAWTYFYTDFPIVEIDVVTGGTIERSTGLRGGHCLACDGAHALLVGGYDADRNRLALLALGQEAEVVARGIYIAEPPAPGTASLLTARDDVVHIVSNGLWRQLTVGEAIRMMIGSGKA